MKNYKVIIIFINLIVVLVLFNNGILKKEDTLKNGKLVLLKLAPVDPRSLIQGDYMRLNYEISRNRDNKDINKTGYIVIKITNNSVAEKIRIQANSTPLNKGEYLIKYTTKNFGSTNIGSINIGAESYFFQEGDAEKYEKAEYGGIKIDSKGNSLLVGLFDKDKNKIE